MKLAILFNDDKIWGKLTNLFTGCYAYHAGWVSDDGQYLYDIHLIRRRRLWPGKYKEDHVVMVNFPEVTKEYLEDMLTTDNTGYSYLDYLLFLVRPLYHLVGKSTRNQRGMICSEMMNIDLINCGVKTPWSKDDEPPSPCDLFRWVMSRK